MKWYSILLIFYNVYLTAWDSIFLPSWCFLQGVATIIDNLVAILKITPNATRGQFFVGSVFYFVHDTLDYLCAKYGALFRKCMISREIRRCPAMYVITASTNHKRTSTNISTSLENPSAAILEIVHATNRVQYTWLEYVVINSTRTFLNFL